MNIENRRWWLTLILIFFKDEDTQEVGRKFHKRQVRQSLKPRCHLRTDNIADSSFIKKLSNQAHFMFFHHLPNQAVVYDAAMLSGTYLNILVRSEVEQDQYNRNFGHDRLHLRARRTIYEFSILCVRSMYCLWKLGILSPTLCPKGSYIFFYKS